MVRVVMPGTARIAASTIGQPGRATSGRAVLCAPDWSPVVELDEVPAGALYLSWRGRVFRHWAGRKWREVVPVVVA